MKLDGMDALNHEMDFNLTHFGTLHAAMQSFPVPIGIQHCGEAVRKSLLLDCLLVGHTIIDSDANDLRIRFITRDIGNNDLIISASFKLDELL